MGQNRTVQPENRNTTTAVQRNITENTDMKSTEWKMIAERGTIAETENTGDKRVGQWIFFMTDDKYIF